MSDRDCSPRAGSRIWQQTALTFAVQLTLSFAFWSYAPMVDFIRRDLGLSAAQLALIPVILEGAGLTLAPLAGWWVDRARPKFVAQVLLLSSVAGLVIAGSPGKFVTVLVGLFFLGMSFVAVGSMTNRMLASNARPNRLGTAYSVKQSSVTVGMLIGVIVLPPIASHAGWRTAFLFAAAATAVLGGLSVWRLIDAPRSAKVQTAGSGAVRDFGSQFASALRSPGMRLLFAIGFVFQGVIYTFMTFFVPFVVDADRLSTGVAIALLGAIQLVAIVTRPVLGWLSDIWPATDRTYYLVALAGFTGFVMMSSWGKLRSSVHVGLLVAGGAAAFAWIGIYFARLAELSAGTGLGLATGVVLVPIKLGGMTIPLAMGVLIDRFSYRVAFLVAGAALIACSGLWWSIMARRPRINHVNIRSSRRPC